MADFPALLSRFTSQTTSCVGRGRADLIEGSHPESGLRTYAFIGLCGHRLSLCLLTFYPGDGAAYLGFFEVDP